MSQNIALLDYGLGNLLSIGRAFVKEGVNVNLVSTAEGLKEATHLILPGVGAFSNAMDRLRYRKLIEPIQDWFEEGKPIMGICLGMQLMLDRSYEFGEHEGIGLIPGSVKPIVNHFQNKQNHKVPHIGWYPTYASHGHWSSESMQDIPFGESFYYVHSFASYPDDLTNEVGFYESEGERIPAIIKSKNAIGMQFHPEKSGLNGLQVIRSFIKIA